MGSRAKGQAGASRGRGGGGALLGALTVGVLLWRVQLTMFLNQTIRSRNVGRIVLAALGAVVVFIAWAWEAFVTALAVVASHQMPVSIDLLPILSLAFLGYTAILAFSSLVFSLNALLLNPDLDLLLVSSRPVESILGGRMVVQLLRLMLLGLLFTAPALLVIAITTHNPVLPLGFALLYFLYPTYIVVIVSLLSLLLVRVIPPGRGREVIAILGVLLALGINMANFLLNPALRGGAVPQRFGPSSLANLPNVSSPWFPPGWAGRAAAAMLTGQWLTAMEWLAVLALISLLLFASGGLLSGRLYMAGWIQAVRPRRRAARTQKAGRRPLAGRLGLLDPVEAAILVKDWRMRTRDLAQLVRFLMPVVFLIVIFALRFPQLPASVERLGQGPVAAMVGLAPAWFLLFSLSISLGLSAVSLEGKNIWIYAASPNPMHRLLQAKCWSTALPTAALVGAVTIATELVIRPGWSWAIAAVAAAMMLSAGISAVMVGLGAIFARFDWTDSRRMVNPAAVFIGMFLFIAVSIGIVLLFGIALALAGAAHLSEISVWLIAVLVAVGAVIAIAALGLLFGNERLRGLEFG